MCLWKVISTYNPPLSDECDAWKAVVYDYRDRCWTTPYRGTPVSTAWSKRDVLKCKISTSTLANSIHPEGTPFTKYYESGFHVFATEADAIHALELLGDEDFVLVKVRVRGITSEGYDASDSSFEYVDSKIHTLVTNEMRVVELPPVPEEI